MSTPRLYNVRETSERVRRSSSWLYRHAGKTIPVIQHVPGGQLFWTDEMIVEIIRLGAIEPGRKSAPPSASSRRRAASQPSTPAVAGNVRRLEARPEARRKGRRSA